MWLTTPPPVVCATSLPVDLAKKDDFLPMGLPSTITEVAPPCRSAAIARLGSGVGIGPAGGVGGHRQTSGNAVDCPALPACTTDRLFTNTVSPTASDGGPAARSLSSR